MSDEITRISPSGYDAKEDFLKLAEKFYELGNINTLKTGLLGHQIEIASHIFKHGVHQRNFLYNEYFPNTANLPQSIYSFAKNINYDVNLATPSKLDITFIISKNDIIKHGKLQKDGSILFTIGKNNTFYVKSYPFMLEYDVIITATRNSDVSEYAISATNNINSQDQLPFSNLSNPYIKLWIETVNAEPYIFLNLTVWQMIRNTKKFTIFSNDVSEVLMFDVNYTGQLAFFNTYYRYPVSQPFRFLPKYFNNIFTPEGVNEFCYYNYPSDTSLQIMFSGLAGTFRPQFNSEILVEYYTTLGSQGIFSYKTTSEIGFRFQESELSSIPVMVKSISDASGGKDRQTLKQIKQSVIRENFYRGNLATDPDLTNYFSSVVDKNSINGSEIVFVKKRDDVIRRIYSAFLLLKNSDSLIIPTNTINLDIDIATLNKNNYKLNAGSMVIYDKISNSYRLLRDDEFPESYINSDRIILYSLPYLLNVNIDPATRVSYYKNSIDTNVNLGFKHISLINPNQFLINQFNVKRNSLLGDNYKISFVMNTDLTSKIVTNNIKIVGLLKRDNEIYGYLRFDLENVIASENIVEYQYSTNIFTDNTFNNKGQMTVTGGVIDIATGLPINKLNVDEELTLELAIFTNKENTTLKPGVYDRIEELSNYSTIRVLEATDTFSFAKSMDLLMNSDLEINSGSVLSIKNVPVVSTKYFNKYENFKEFYQILDHFYDILSNSIDKLQNLTTVDVKFYNTHGISKQYSIDTVNISLDFNFRLNTTTNIDYLDNEFKKAIVAFVNNTNNTKLFSISTLSTHLQNTFNEINFVEFVSMNGLNIQRIEEIESNTVYNPKTREQIINYVPEYINVGIDFNDDNSFVINPTINIKYI